jgi:Uncharacterised protein family (UPF0236)
MEKQIHDIIMPLAHRLIKQLSQLLEQHPKSLITLFGLELMVWKLLAGLGLELMGALLAFLLGGERPASHIRCAGCGGQMKYQGEVRRWVISCFGKFSYRRAYYYCRACHLGKAPGDERLETTGHQVSPRLQRILAFLAGHLSCEVTQKAVQECYQLELSDEAIRQVAEAIGQEARQWEDQQQQAAADQPLERKPLAQKAKTWVVEIDGKKVGFQDGSWQEVKVAVLYQLSDRVEIHSGRAELVKRELIARRCEWQEFAGLVWAAMRRVGVREGDRVIAIADGAEGLESIFDWVAPEAQRIRDFYHVAERIHAVGELRFGAGTPQAQRWIRLRLHQLKASELSTVIRSISHLQFDSQQAEHTRAQVLGYLEKHRAAMNYRDYQKEGLPIGSGAVEGGCRLVGARTNGCGRRWSLAGCDQMVALRTAVLTDRLDRIRPQPKIELGEVA